MEFTYQEKIAIMRILLDIINADGIIDARETFFYNQLKELFELDESSYKDVQDKNSLLALIQIRTFNEEQKTYFAKLMSKMIVVDEDINVNELATYNVVAEFCNIESKFEENIPDSDSYSHS